jgi:hypothetical protein
MQCNAMRRNAIVLWIRIACCVHSWLPYIISPSEVPEDETCLWVAPLSVGQFSGQVCSGQVCETSSPEMSLMHASQVKRLRQPRTGIHSMSNSWCQTHFYLVLASPLKCSNCIDEMAVQTTLDRGPANENTTPGRTHNAQPVGADEPPIPTKLQN